MGVDNLWMLLHPAGTKITIDSLATRKLAVDASLWLVQFIKAMRTQDGEMMHNCHLLGLFRRICKLLFYNIKPVFVFDGPPPKLKRKTIKQRRIRREKSENDIKKQAERLFLNRCQMAAISISKKQLKKLQKQKENSNDNHNKQKKKHKKKKKKHKKHKKHKKNKKQKSPNSVHHHSARIDIDDTLGLNEMEDGFVFDPVDPQHQNKDTMDDHAGGFFVDENHANHDEIDGGFCKDNDIEILNNNQNIHNMERKNNDKEEMSDDDIASRALVHNTNINDDGDNSMDPDLYQQMKETNVFHTFPQNIAQLTAKDIAELPASMQFEIMSKRRELLRHKTRGEFVAAAGNPSQYAEVQLKNFLKTSNLNQKIECLRKQTAEQFNRELLGMEGEGDVKDNKTQRVGRIASEGDKLFVIKQTQQRGNDGYRFKWMDKETKRKRREYMNHQRYYKKKRRGKYGGKSDYIARTLNIKANKDGNSGNRVKSDIVFEHWSCPVCKYLNLKQRPKCDVCGIIRDTVLHKWICSECTYCNEGNDKQCILCDCVHVGDMKLVLEEREGCIRDGDDDMDIDDDDDDDDIWICGLCHWKNSMLCRYCTGCNKVKGDDGEMDEVEDIDVVGVLEVVVDDEGDDDECMEIDNVDRCNGERVMIHECDDDDDDLLILSAPKLRIHVDESLDDTMITTPERGISPTKASPSKSSSQITQMASSNVKSLLNIRDSLNNFYNIARLTQQSTVLEEINDTIQQSDDVEMIGSDDNVVEIAVEVEESNVAIIEYSEHESDDDIIKEMDVTPGYFETPKEPEIETVTVENAEQTEVLQRTPLPSSPIADTDANSACEVVMASDMDKEQKDEDVDHVPDSFLFEIPTFEQVEEAEKFDIIKLNTIPSVAVSDRRDRDEDEEKEIELLKAIHVEQISVSDDDINETRHDEHKPLKKRGKKRKWRDINGNDNDRNTSETKSVTPSKKRKLNANEADDDDDDEENIVCVDRNIGLNEGEIQNSLQRLYRMEDNIIEKNILLNESAAHAIRDSEHITQRMVEECLCLLDLFGIPYITSPSEAEAQCAQLNELGLVDGIITDDCDVLLFGGKTIYKNLFHMNKYVEKYTSSLLESKLGLTRTKLISMAMLLGSDYTDGIKGIGPVNGLEIVHTFCDNHSFEGLNAFKKWIYCTASDKKPIKKADLNIQTYDEYIGLRNAWFKYKHNNIKKHWFVSHDFPTQEVIETYLKPDVDESDTAFEWGKPDINKLKVFCGEKFEWDEHTINRTLDPIQKIVEYGRGAVQSSILSFADWIQPNKRIKSLRVQKAVKALMQEIEMKNRIDAQNASSSLTT